MNTDLSTIDNMLFAGTAVAAPPAPKPNTFTNATRLSPAADDTPPIPNTLEPTTTYNTHAVTQNEPPQDFRHALHKAATDKPPEQSQDNEKPEKQDSACEIPSRANLAQPLPVPEIPTTLGALVKKVATKMEPKTESQLAQLIANLKDGKSTSVTGHAAKSAEIKLLVTTDKSQLGIKTILPEKSEGQTGLKTTLTDTSKGQPGLQAVLTNTSESTPTADTQAGQGENADKLPLLNGTAIPTKAPTNGENAEELISNVLVDNDSKTTAIGEKTATAGTSAVADTQKTILLVAGGSNNKLTSETPDSKTTTTGEEAAKTDKPASPDNEKTPTLITNFPSVQTKSPEAQSQTVVIAPEKPAPIAKQTSNSNAATPQILSESSGGNGKESPRAGNKLPDDSTAQKLYTTELQVSTSQTKDRGNSTSNNSFNSDLEQILSHNNPQTPVTEQSPTSSKDIRTANLPGQTSPSDVSADIGKQILESIHSSLSQKGQDQQITVRLNPPELGKVFIKFQEQDGQIIGLLEVSKPQTRIEIQQVLPQIIQNLQASSIQVKRVEVVLSEADQPEQEAFKDSASGELQNGWGQQKDSTNSYMGGNNPDAGGINEWLINNYSFRNISELQEALITDGINMLA